MRLCTPLVLGSVGLRSWSSVLGFNLSYPPKPLDVAPSCGVGFQFLKWFFPNGADQFGVALISFNLGGGYYLWWLSLITLVHLALISWSVCCLFSMCMTLSHWRIHIGGWLLISRFAAISDSSGLFFLSTSSCSHWPDPLCLCVGIWDRHLVWYLFWCYIKRALLVGCITVTVVITLLCLSCN